MVEETIEYTFQMVDNVSGPSATMAESQDKLASAGDQATASQDSLNSASNTAMLTFITQMTVMHGLRTSVMDVTRGLTELGIVNGQTAKDLRDVGAAFQLIIGFEMGIKAVSQAVEMLKDQEVLVAAVESFRAAISSPLGAAAVGVGLGVAGGVGAMLMTQNNSQQTNVNQTVTFTGAQADQTDMSSALYNSMGNTVRG